MRILFAQGNIPTSFAPTITVTGSKGKGSTAILSATFLQAAGHRVGLLTSPHFLSHRERIRVNGQAIPEIDFRQIVTDLAETIRNVDQNLSEKQYLSPTGLFLAVAIRFFLKEGVTAAVLEVGRGGRYDDVSLIDNAVACLTPIMGEHHDKLGNTLSAIAEHKSGIIKPGSIVVSARQTEEVMSVFDSVCERVAATKYVLEQEVHVGATYEEGLQEIQVRIDPFDLRRSFKLRTSARYQAQNLALAFAASFALDQRVADIDPTLIQQVRLPGRCDVIHQAPPVIVDGAINRQSALVFLESVLPIIHRPITLVTALPDDKDYQGVLDTLLPETDYTIITQVSASHLTFRSDVFDYACRLSEEVLNQPAVDAAFLSALEYTQANGGMIWVVGTQSLVRDALRFWDVRLDSLFIIDR